MGVSEKTSGINEKMSALKNAIDNRKIVLKGLKFTIEIEVLEFEI